MPATIIFYRAEDGASDVEEFLRSLNRKARDKCLAYVDKLRDPGLPLTRNYSAPVRGRIWELRPEWSGTEYQLLYARLSDGRFVILTAFKKDRQKLRERDIIRAEERLTEIEQRLKR